MRSSPTNPARQLRSIAGRYRHALAAGDRAAPWAWRKSATKSRPPRLFELDTEPENAAARLARLEAILLLAREPLGSRKLSQYANLADGTEARTLIRRLNENYDHGGRAFRVEEVAGGFQLLTRRKFATWLRRLGHIPPELRLSAPALETLAVIAYRQPVPRADIEAIRGVNCGEILRQLMERDLVRIGGRSAELGRPFLYSTTKQFLQIFGLISLEDLPRSAAIRSSPVLPALPRIAPADLLSDGRIDEPTNEQADESETPIDEGDFASELGADPASGQHELEYTADSKYSG